jgi:tRNA G26 N,N-dimethylase Trm1
MSHFTTIKVQIKNGETLRQCLQELGYVVECNTQVRGYQGNKTQAEYVIRQGNGYDLGFRRDGENYEVVADFWGAKINQQEFINSISQRYAHKTLMASVQSQGFNVEEEETLSDGTVRVVVGKWV